MAQHHQLSIGPVPVEPDSRARESAHPESREGVHPRQGDKPSLTSLLAESCEGCGLSEKDAALSQGYDPKYWPRIKSGEKAAHLERVGRLPEKVQREFVKRYAAELKMHVSEQDAQKQAALDLAKAAIGFLELAK